MRSIMLAGLISFLAAGGMARAGNTEAFSRAAKVKGSNQSGAEQCSCQHSATTKKNKHKHTYHKSKNTTPKYRHVNRSNQTMTPDNPPATGSSPDSTSGTVPGAASETTSGSTDNSYDSGVGTTG